MKTSLRFNGLLTLTAFFFLITQGCKKHNSPILTNGLVKTLTHIQNNNTTVQTFTYDQQGRQILLLGTGTSSDTTIYLTNQVISLGIGYSTGDTLQLNNNGLVEWASDSTFYTYDNNGYNTSRIIHGSGPAQYFTITNGNTSMEITKAGSSIDTSYFSYYDSLPDLRKFGQAYYGNFSVDLLKTAINATDTLNYAYVFDNNHRVITRTATSTSGSVIFTETYTYY